MSTTTTTTSINSLFAMFDLQTILFANLVALVLYYVGTQIWHYTCWWRQGVPGEAWPTLAGLRQPFHDWLLGYNRKYGRVSGGFVASVKMLFIDDIDLIQQVSIKEASKFAERSTIYFGKSSVTRSLFFLPISPAWKRIRSIVTPAFTSGKLREMCQPIETVVGKFIDYLGTQADTGKEFDIRQYCDSLTMDVIARCGFGVDVDTLADQNHPIVANARRILGTDISLSLFICFMFPWLAKLLRLEGFDYQGVKFFDNLTAEIVKKRTASGEQSKDLIGLLLKHLRSDGSENDKQNNISTDELSAQSILFFLAGHDTTKNVFVHVFYFLTRYPQWQQRLYEEIKANETALDDEHLKTLPVLNGIINETLRLKPSLLAFNREPIEDTYLGGIFLPKGTAVSISPYVVHRDPEYFPDPESFKPERFIEGDAASSPAFIPFGIGPRLCIGMRFAMSELRIGVANFVLNYELVANPNLELDYTNGNIVLSPLRVMVKINKRT